MNERAIDRVSTRSLAELAGDDVKMTATEIVEWCVHIQTATGAHEEHVYSSSAEASVLATNYLGPCRIIRRVHHLRQGAPT